MTPETKKCGLCHDVKSLEDFPRDRSKRSGRHSHCRSCRTEYQARYRATHAKEVSATRAKYRANNKAKIAEYDARYRATRKRTAKAVPAETTDEALPQLDAEVVAVEATPAEVVHCPCCSGGKAPQIQRFTVTVEVAPIVD